MGKKSKKKCWLIKYPNLPTVELYARTEGAAKVAAFRFLLNKKVLNHNQRKDFFELSIVGILRTPTEEEK